MPFEHPSGLPYAYQRSVGDPSVQSVVHFGARPFIQGADLHDAQHIQRARSRRVSRLIAADGDRIEGAAAIVDREAETVNLTAGRIYVDGDVLLVNAAQIDDVSMDTRVEIGVRLVRQWITSEDDPTLMGLVPGSLAEGEDGAAREIVSLAWALSDDGGDGAFYQVYVLQNGTILDQPEPPFVQGIVQAIASYDRVYGHYIVRGCRVSALGANGDAQVFSIEEGEANIDGFKRTRFTALRHSEVEDWDVSAVPGETHTYDGSPSQIVTIARAPIDGVTSVLLDKEKTVSVVRGAIANGADNLPDNSVIEIVSVVQGATTYEAGTDFNRVGDSVDWAPAGAEPATSTSYDVTYRYRASVVPDAVTNTTLEVSGGAAGGDIIIAYTWKLPRIDMLCLDKSGAAVYVHGVSAVSNPVPPIPPANVLPLAEIHNDWFGMPGVISDGIRTGVRAPTWSEYRRFMNLLEDHSRLIQLERLKSNVDARDPAAKRNMFVDPFVDDSLRDVGEAQTGAIGNGLMQLAIEPTFYDLDLSGPVTLDWVEEVIVEQALRTGCERINPYQNFSPMPGALNLTPAVDFWTESATQWASPQTIEFNRGVSISGARVQSSTATQTVSSTTEELPFLRQRDVEFVIAGFFEGEILDVLTFDDIDVKPAGEQAADENGEITGSFTIPANVPAGTKEVIAEGQGGTLAVASFTGQGTLETDVMRRVTTVQRWDAAIVQRRQNDDDEHEETNGERRMRETGSFDPQAQIFNLPSTRQIVGVDFHLCALGDLTNHILIHQVGVDTGWPTTDVEAEAFVPMAGAQTGWKSARYGLPVTVSAGLDRAVVIKTDDGEHAISFASLGGFDAEAQRPVTTHPYPIGPRLSSVNARTWTAHQNDALAFRLVAARYTQTTKTVELGTVDVVDCSDLQVRAVVDVPSPVCSVVFEIERAGGEIYRLLPWQVLQLDEFITETVTVRAILTGTERLSPVLFAPVELIAGEIATEATYVSKVIDISDAIRVSAYLKAAVPAGASLTLEYDYADDGWEDLPLHATEISPDPAWVERNFRAAIDGQQMRIRISLTGGPAARPVISDFGVGII